MAGLSVIFKAVDEISDKLDAMSNAGNKALDAFDELSDTADKAFANTTEGTQKAAESMEKAAAATDYWTDAVGNYDKSALEFIYTTEELVDMGYKTEDALRAEAIAAEEASEETEQLGEKMEEASEKSEDFGEKSQDAIIGLDDVLATAGIAAALSKIAEAFTNATEAAAAFETNVAMVSTVADTTVLSAEQLGAQISALSSENAKSVNELADATYNAISAGVATEQAVDTVGEASKLATAGFTSASSALSVLTTALNAYKLDASEVTNISDSLIVSQNLGVMTIDQLSSSMGKAISTASAYSIDLYNLESGYISLTKAGVSVEESTTYLASMFNELGDSGSDVAEIIKNETGQSFGQLMQDGYSLADVLGILYENVDQNSEALMNLWGSAEAGKAANAVISQGLDTFNNNLQTLQTSTGITASSYSTMTNTATYATERMQNSFDNLAIAIGDDLNPVVSDFKNGVADMVDQFTALVTKYPEISYVISGAAVGITTVTGAITAYTAVSKLAAVASSALGVSITAALGPLGLIAAAIGGVTTALLVVKNNYDEVYDSTMSMTAVTREQTEELDRLQAKYEEACDVYGETSEEASRLKYQIDDLQSSIDANGQSMEEWCAEMDAVSESHNALMEQIKNTDDELNSQELKNLSLITKLEDLADQTYTTGASQEAMKAILDDLNSSIDGCNVSYTDLISNTDASIQSIREAAEAQAEQQRRSAQMENYINLLADQTDQENALAEATEQAAAAEKEADRAHHKLLESQKDSNGHLSGWKMFWSWTTEEQAANDAAQDALDEYNENLERAQSELDETNAKIAAIEDEWNGVSDAVDEASKVTSDGYAEATSIIEGCSDALTELCTDYDEAYESALQSVQGQYDLWTEVEDVTAMTSQSIKDALQSQIDYWTSYNDNITSLTARADDIEGLSDMLAELSDGSEESAAMLAGMESMNDADLSAVVQQYTSLQTAQSETATSMAELETDFSDSLAKIQTDMETAVDNMDLSAEAKTNAKSTMDAYVKEIQNGVARAQTAMNSLSFAKTTLGNGGYHAYAEGTVDAEPGLALVGEEGPELVNFGGGEVVYTADETANILAKDTTSDSFYVAPDSNVGDTGSGDRTVTFRVEGAGEMKVTGNGVSKDDVVSLLMSNIKDALMGIIQQEIEEEGDLSYEF